MTAFTTGEWITRGNLIGGGINFGQLFASIDRDKNAIAAGVVLTVARAAAKFNRSQTLICFRIYHGVRFSMQIRNIKLVLFAGVGDAIRVIARRRASYDGETLIVNYCQ